MALDGKETKCVTHSPPGIDVPLQTQPVEIGTPSRGPFEQAFPRCGTPRPSMAQQQKGQSTNFMKPPPETAPPMQMPYHQVPRSQAPPPPPMSAMRMAEAVPMTGAMAHGQNMSA